MPHLWYDRRSSRRVAEAVSVVGLLAFVSPKWTGNWVALTSAFVCFFIGTIVAARARAWSVFYSDLLLMLLVAFIALIGYIFTHATWGF
jgi:predicted Co/Zn/Cd cation transporter (cation efflux family)